MELVLRLIVAPQRDRTCTHQGAVPLVAGGRLAAVLPDGDVHAGGGGVAAAAEAGAVVQRQLLAGDRRCGVKHSGGHTCEGGADRVSVAAG